MRPVREGEAPVSDEVQDRFGLGADELARVARLTEAYRAMRLDPAGCRPMVHVNFDGPAPRFKERWDDPAVMLADGLELARARLDLGDDRLPTLRVEFGTGLMAGAFGARFHVKPDSLPFAEGGTASLQEALSLPDPDASSGLFPKAAEFAEYMLEHLPQGYLLQHPDIQGVFNTAHLVRGNDILMDFYDSPEETGNFLDKVTDAMIRIVPELLKRTSPAPEGWFADWGALWQGAARISNCSMEMISPDFYRQHVRPRDVRLLEALGGGRVHYCGSHTEVLLDFAELPLCAGMDFDLKLHDLDAVSKTVPAELVIMVGLGNPEDEPARNVLAAPPEKRNIIYAVEGDPAACMAWRAELLKKYGAACRR